MALSDTTKIVIIVGGTAVVLGTLYMVFKPAEAPTSQGDGFAPYNPALTTNVPQPSGDAAAVSSAIASLATLGGSIAQQVGLRDRQRAELADTAEARREAAAERRDQLAFCRAHPEHPSCTNGIRSAAGGTAQRSPQLG